MTELPSSFLSLLNTVHPNQLKYMKRIIADRIANAPKATDYVTHIECLEEVTEVLLEEVWKEAVSLNLHTRPGNGVKSFWLSLRPGGYSFGGRSYPANDIRKYPATRKLMDIINSHPESTHNMDCVLISYYPTPKSQLSYHTDDEAQICQLSSICSFSLGESKTFEIVKKSPKVTRSSSSSPPLLSANLVEGSLTIMKPGCQQLFKHGVRPGPSSTPTRSIAGRFAFSFRKYVSSDSVEESFSDSELLIPVLASPKATAPNLFSSLPSPASVHGPCFSPVEPSLASTPTKHPPSPRVQPITLLAGDSFFRDLRPDKLGKGKKLVVNISKGGSKIKQVEQSLIEFASDAPPVTKIFLSIGANDIHHAKCGVQHLKTPVASLLKTAKDLFPRAKIWVQSILPIPLQRKMMINDVCDMNKLLHRACMRQSVFFLDVTDSFIDQSTGLRDVRFFPIKGNVHLGPIGTSVLAKIYIRQIHSRSFNPLGY